MCNDRIWILLTRKLSGEATATELKELDDLLVAEPAQVQTVELISSGWQTPSAPAGDFLEATYLAHVERAKEKGHHINNDEQISSEDFPEPSSKNTLFSRRWISAFAMLMLLGLAAVLFINSKNTVAANTDNAASREVVTKNGNRTKVKLPDGTDVWLNSGSKLIYGKNFNVDNRDVQLTGEAYFDVVHNAEKPFIIHTSRIAVKVLGTQFNVKAYENDISTETSLINGKVEVTLNAAPEKKYFLKPHEKLVLPNSPALQANIAPGNTKPVKITTAKIAEPEIKPISFLIDQNTNIESSWTRNILSFEDELFSEVTKKMERWYDVEIVFSNKRLQHKHISGAFEHENLEQALAALQYSTGFKYKKSGNEINIY